MGILEAPEITGWRGRLAGDIARQATDALEQGKVLYLPKLPFALSDSERRFLSPDCLDGKSKNVSYRPDSGAIRGTSREGSEREELLGILKRYCESASTLLRSLCPEYADRLTPGFTSLRPIEIAGRTASWRKDDTRLHVDAFPSRPLRGLRIMRMFSNVNADAPRVWRTGELFGNVAARFIPGIQAALPGTSWLLEKLHIVKGRRTEYDHLMLGIHNRMKADENYQKNVPQARLELQPGTTWACFTDSVSHAAMSGQFAFEQTFYLPVGAMRNPEHSPLHVLERLAGRTLI